MRSIGEAVKRRPADVAGGDPVAALDAEAEAGDVESSCQDTLVEKSLSS